MAWKPLGWQAVAFSEIEPFPRAVLEHHYPDVPLHGDFTKLKGDEHGPIDVLVGGTPCQSFSVAGLRAGMDDPRGNLALGFLGLAARARPTWVVWENVPGVLSSHGGRDFGAFLGALEQCGYGWAYRVLDAQYFGVPQRRRRVFVIGHLGDWRRAAAVLFERESLSGNPPPRRKAGARVAKTLAGGAEGRGWSGFSGSGGGGVELVAATLNSGGNSGGFRTEPGEHLVIAIQERAVAENPDSGPDGKGYRDDGQAYTLEGRSTVQAVAYAAETCPPINAGGNNTGGDRPFGTAADTAESLVALQADQHWAVRRLTPRECERLQGFPEVQKCYMIAVCRNLSGHQKANAPAALQCRKLQNNAWVVGADGWTLSAEAAADHFNTSHQHPASPVAIDVLIDLERQVVRLHSAGKSFSPVSNAVERSEFPLPRGIESIAHTVALLTHVWALATQGGKAGSPASMTTSTADWSGSSIALAYGREIDESVADASESINLASRLTTSTILPSGLDIQTVASTLKTLSCCVVRAIDGYIPAQTREGNSYSVRLTTVQGYTQVPYRGKPAADSPRYKGLGNSMAVPVMRWIGERIQQAEAL